MIKKYMLLIIFSGIINVCFGDCPDDHIIIGCNQDAIAGTDDDTKLFADCAFKYRHSGDTDWQNWYYPLGYDPINDLWYLTEPGIEMSEDSDKQLSGIQNIDYSIIIKCISIKPGFSAGNTTHGIQFCQAGDLLNFSLLSQAHLHLEYRAPASTGGNELQWITFIIYDELNQYEPSEPFSIAFGAEPQAGDLVIDGKVDINDLAEMAYYWLEQNGDKVNDYYERADVNKDGKVNFRDFALLAQNYMN